MSLNEKVLNDPVCLVKQGENGIELCDDGIQILQKIQEPIVVICLAGQYRTGKSFFLNQLSGGQPLNRKTNTGFVVGRTTESCTRGIWIWDPLCNNIKGEKIILLDTEGMAALDNDETYDAKIFSLGLLLSSLFIFNSIGVIDESAIDRLYLVSELTKNICLATNTNKKPANDDNNNNTNFDEEINSNNMKKEEELAPHFPPFIWLLRDFILEMEIDGKKLTPNEYLENALEMRDSTSRRHEERNRIRRSLRILFPKRECMTLVRPAMDETKLRMADSLNTSDLRPEFVQQMNFIRQKIFTIARPKILFGQVFDGIKLSHLVKVYINTMNNGSVPDIRGAYEYVSESTNRSAEEKALEYYNENIKTSIQINENNINEIKLMNHIQFETLHKTLQDEITKIYKKNSTDGPTRLSCFENLKKNVINIKNNQYTILMAKSKDFCQKIIKELVQECFMNRINKFFLSEINKDKYINNFSTIFEEGIQIFLNQYNLKAQGPEKETILLDFLSDQLINKIFSQYLQVIEKRSNILFNEAENHAKNELNDLNKEKLMIENLLNNEKTNNIRLKDSLKNLEEKFESITLQLKESKDNFKEMKDKNIKLEDYITEERKVKEETSLMIQKYENVSNELKIKLGYSDNHLIKLKEEIEELKIQKIKHFEIEKEKQNKQKEIHLMEISKMENHISNLQNDLNNTKNEYNHVKSINNKLNESKNELNLKLQETNNNINDLRLEIDEKNSEIIKIKKDYDDLYNINKLNENSIIKDKNMYELRIRRIQGQLGQIKSDIEIKKILDECIYEIIRLIEIDKNKSLIEERNTLQERVGDLYLKISILPDFYQRQIFCSQEPSTDFFEAMTSFTWN